MKEFLFYLFVGFVFFCLGACILGLPISIPLIMIKKNTNTDMSWVMAFLPMVLGGVCAIILFIIDFIGRRK